MTITTLNVATYNIYNTTARYNERIPLLFSVLDRWCSDDGISVVGLQECRFKISGGQRHDEAEKEKVDEVGKVLSGERSQLDAFMAMGWKNVIESRLQSPILAPGDPTFRIDGNAFLTMHADGGDYDGDGGDYDGDGTGDWLLLSSATHHIATNRNAQIMTLQNTTDKELTVHIVNTHLHWSTNVTGMSTREDAKIRGEQFREVLRLTREIASGGGDPIILMGDFNLWFEDELIIDLFSEHGYRSCMKEATGQEAFTVHKNLLAPTIDPEGVCEQKADFILIRDGDKGKKFSVQGCGLSGCDAKDDDDTLYASDHFGVWAKLTLN